MLTLAAEWWTPQTSVWIGVTVGTLGGILGTAIGCSAVLVRQGRGKGPVLGMLWLMTATGVLGLTGGLAALVFAQRYHVWFPLLLWGVIGTLVGSLLTVTVRRQYALAEERKVDAEALRRGG